MIPGPNITKYHDSTMPPPFNYLTHSGFTRLQTHSGVYSSPDILYLLYHSIYKVIQIVSYCFSLISLCLIPLKTTVAFLPSDRNLPIHSLLEEGRDFFKGFVLGLRNLVVREDPETSKQHTERQEGVVRKHVLLKNV